MIGPKILKQRVCDCVTSGDILDRFYYGYECRDHGAGPCDCEDIEWAFVARRGEKEILRIPASKLDQRYEVGAALLHGVGQFINLMAVDIDALLEKLTPLVEFGKLDKVEAILLKLLEVMTDGEKDTGMETGKR